MADWANISALATGGGTLVLALATFASVRSANRAARVAERSLMIALRPVLVTSRVDEDPPESVAFGDRAAVTVPAGHVHVEAAAENIYMVMPVRNVGSGMGVIHGWYARPRRDDPADHADPDQFRRQSRDLYVPPSDRSFWQGAVRGAEDPFHDALDAAIESRESITIELLYGDHEGGQRTISRFTAQPRDGSTWACAVTRHWMLDGPAPR